MAPLPTRADAPKPADYIKAEIRGTLVFEHGTGAYVSIKAAGKPEIRVWLWISENKVLARQIESLTGKAVVVRGTIHQMDANTRTSVPPLGLYVEGDLAIEAAK